MVRLSLSTVAILPSASAAKAAEENMRAATRAPIRLRISDLFLFFAQPGRAVPRREAEQKHPECVKTLGRFCTALFLGLSSLPGSRTLAASRIRSVTPVLRRIVCG